jgi:hypothetical protein
MKSTGDGSSTSYFRTGNISGTGIVVGNGSSAVVGQLPDPEHPELIDGLNNLIELLAQHKDSVEDESGLRESIVEARQEVEKPTPRWAFVRTLLKGVAASVTGVQALTDAVGNILTIVSKIAH